LGAQNHSHGGKNFNFFYIGLYTSGEKFRVAGNLLEKDEQEKELPYLPTFMATL
jgi:hypothetical protein